MIAKRLKFITWTTLIIIAVCLDPLTALSNDQTDFKILVGQWVRTDGGFIVHVRDVKSDGFVDVKYLNPKNINVEEAEVSRWKGLLKLFFKLNDKGYPGSTYQLYYYAEQDSLIGFYCQAALDQTFEVIFLRKPTQ